MTTRTARPRSTPPPAPRAGPRVPVLAVALAGIAVVLVVAVVVALGSGDADVATGPATGPSTNGLRAVADVDIEGSLPTYDEASADPALGQAAPVLTGVAPDGTPISVGDDGIPTVIAFLAHWCPHCQAEVPVLVELADSGAIDGIRLVGVLTGTNVEAPNYPPAPWLEREGWPGEVLLDDGDFSAGRAYGLAGYPFLVAINGAGEVVGRTSGEVPASEVQALAEAALGG